MTAEPEAAAYLGDGAYAVRLAWGVELYTTNGVAVTNRVVLEPPVLAAFLDWLRREGAL